MVISKGFSLITNAILDENKLQTLDDIKMAKKPKKRSISEPGPGKEDEGSKDSLSRSDDSDFLEKDEIIEMEDIGDESLYLFMMLATPHDSDNPNEEVLRKKYRIDWID